MAHPAGHRKTAPLHPGPIARTTIVEDCRVSERQAARDMGISSTTLNNFLSGKAPCTPALAARLGKYLGNGGRIWLSMQADYDLHQAEKELKTELAKISKIEAA